MVPNVTAMTEIKRTRKSPEYLSQGGAGFTARLKPAPPLILGEERSFEPEVESASRSAHKESLRA
jgi:hypothetical protein